MRRVFPRASLDDGVDVRLRDAESNGEFIPRYAGSGGLANSRHYFSCQFGHAVSLAMGHPAFAGGILNVVSHCSKKQVLGIDAWRVIAPMADGQAFWYGAYVQFVGYAMRLALLAFDGKRPVSVMKARRRPFHASVRQRFHVAFKPFPQIGCAGAALPLHLADIGAIGRRRVGAAKRKCFAANRTCRHSHHFTLAAGGVMA